MEPGVLTFRPDNFLTIGAMVVILYLSAVLIVQLAMRAGLLSSMAPASSSAGPGATV